MQKCNLCPNQCSVNRQNELGYCKSFENLKIAKYSLHHYEEPIISGTNGSGTVFFCGCSLKCAFCQNFKVSRNLTGKEITPKELSDIFKELESLGAHNINLVNPTHYSTKIIEALEIYRPNIPIVYNTHGYESIDVLEKINDYIDIYLTDLKYFSPSVSSRYSKKSDYFEKAIKAVEFMINNKKTVLSGDLLKSGVIVRHLILPMNSSDSVEILTALRPKIKDAYLSLMAQYTPFGEIENLPELKRKITNREYQKVLDKVYELKYENVFIQDTSSSSVGYIPKWDY
ncbi:MAG: radical SAM protein [Clostridia bacterium]|nr:radical SAM protein [Clostridia bacterium]